MKFYFVKCAALETPVTNRLAIIGVYIFVFSGYCDLPKGDTITVKGDKDRFIDGEVLQYQCSQNAEHLNATCVDGKWNMTVECDGKLLKMS